MKISIITITFNSENTIEETVKSVINQKIDDLEYIIVDGKSRDNTLKIIEKYRKNITRIISESDKGISDAFNKGIAAATGDVIGIINSDDVLYPNSLNIVRKKFEDNPEIDVLYGDTIRFLHDFQDGYIKYPDTDLEKLKYTFKINHPSVFVSARAYKKYGGFSCDYKCAMDYDLISRMYYNGAKFMYTNNILSGFREGGESQRKMKRTLNEHKKIAIKNGSNPFLITLYLKKVYIVQFLIRIAQKLHIEKFLRKKIKRQDSIQKKIK